MNKLLKIAALAAFAAAGTTTAFAGTWSGGISSRNSRPYVHALSTGGYSAYAMARDYSDEVPSGIGTAERFGAGSQS
ncbi:MAG: hypothetical protein WBE71_04960 [Xanthobacteraceae bacterium]|jgi:hypothetical protein